jgi:hypothetical protein
MPVEWAATSKARAQSAKLAKPRCRARFYGAPRWRSIYKNLTVPSGLHPVRIPKSDLVDIFSMVGEAVGARGASGGGP